MFLHFLLKISFLVISRVSISSFSGQPGAMNYIRIRGMGSINAGNDPLIVIDGTPVNSGNLSGFNDGRRSGYNGSGTNALSTLNSNDIESITVIKDAAAASLYGSRAANGVLVITTKSGRKVRPRLISVATGDSLTWLSTIVQRWMVILVVP